jgi:hypothetical protein
LLHRCVGMDMRLELDSGHTEEEGCWGCHRAAKLLGAEVGVDAEAGIQAGSLREKPEARIQARDAKGQSETPPRRRMTEAEAGMANHRDRQRRESSAKDGIAAVECRHRMNPWPGPSRARHKAVEAKV